MGELGTVRMGRWVWRADIGEFRSLTGGNGGNGGGEERNLLGGLGFPKGVPGRAAARGYRC